MENHYEHGGCSEQGGEEEGIDDETMRKGMSKRELMRLVKEFQVWEVERIRPGQMLVACPVCKLEQRKGTRVHESMVNSNQFKNHFEQEHKQQKFLQKVRCLKCPICQDLIPARGLYSTLFQEKTS